MVRLHPMAKGTATQGALFLIALVLIGLIHINSPVLDITFLWVPLMGVYLWPRGADAIRSVIYLFLCGFLLDIVSGGPSGFWPMIFLFVFGLIRPHHRTQDVGFLGLWVGFGAVTALMIMLIYAEAIFSQKHAIQWGALIVQVVLAVIVFPLVFMARNSLRNLIADPHMVRE